MDLDAVLASPGVVAVATAADIPGENNYGPAIKDDPIFATDLVQYVGAPLFAVAAESHTAARRAALKAGIATAPGLKAIAAEARDLVRRPVLASELKAVDAVVFDPPRAGALEQSREIAASRAARVIAISCNPATFARDARVLADAGFRLERVHPIDQFLWSPHVELVGVLSR